MARPQKYLITSEDIDFLHEAYPAGDWDTINERLPGVPKHTIYHVVSKNNIVQDNYFWSEHDKSLLIKHYNSIPVQEIKLMLNKTYTIRQIQNQAVKMGLTNNKRWTNDEEEIMLQKYSELGAVGILPFLPNKTYHAIIGKARAMGLQCDCYWSDEEKQLVRDNWDKMTDQELADMLGRGVKGVADQRRKLGLYYLSHDNTTYYDVTDFIRHRNIEWKQLSMQNCKYQCVITGNSDFEIHHTYSFNLILKEAMQDDRWIIKDFSDYTGKELEHLLSIFCEYQLKYPLGVCVAPEYHKMFHSIYGNRVNTPEQWEEFLSICLNNTLITG